MKFDSGIIEWLSNFSRMRGLESWIYAAISGRNTYIGFLVIWVVASECGLVILNRLLLSTSVYRFPYPLTLVLFQNVTTVLLLYLTVHLTQKLLSFLCEDHPHDHSVPSVTDELTTDGWAHPRMVKMVSLGSCWGSGRTRSGFDWIVTRRVASLALVNAAKATLSTWSLSNGQAPLYLLARGGIMPTCLALTVLMEQTIPSRRTIFYSISANLSLLIAICASVFDIIWDTLFAGIVSTVFAVLFPILLLQKYNELDHYLSSQQIVSVNLSPADDANGHRRADGPKRLAFWYILQYTAVLSTGLIFLVVLISGELGHISRNCYIFDVKTFWALLLGSCFSYCSILISTLLLSECTSSATVTFLSLPAGLLQLMLLSHSKLSTWCLVGELMTVWFSWGYLSSQKQEGTTTPARHGRSLWVPVRNAIATFLLTISLVYTFLQPPSITDFIRPTLLTSALPKNPHAKWISRPLKSVAVTDGYLGARPHVDTVADLPLLARTCRDFYSVTERNHDGLKCLIYLATTEAEYYSLPEEGRMLRASEQDPAKAEYADADGYGNSLASYPSPSVATPASKDTIGTCSGPIIPYHSYWIGRASWRVELYVKSYLYTQNLPCSRLWLWLDLDRHPHALRDFREDPAFKLFAPLIARGDIILKGWRFPSQIPLPSNPSKTNPKTFYERPVPLKNDGLLKVADEVTQDAEGQLWLKYNPRFRPFLNDYMSDTARFTILHLHGGLWCDIDILLLRDLRPLVLPHPIHGRLAFGEQWVERSHIADYNSAVLSIMANSSFSTFLLHGGVRMGMNFCPKVLGRMIWKENRTQEFPMLDTAAFDPSTPTINRSKGRKCSVPCHESYSDVFVGRPGVVENEWRDYESTPLKEIASGSKPNTTNPEAFSPIEIIQQFRYEHGEDLYPPNNRSMQNFFRGAWGYHIHNQWSSYPEPSSWLDVIIRTQDEFFAGRQINSYKEKWSGPDLQSYPKWMKFK